MPWRGNTSNPVPSNVDQTKKNSYFTNQQNKAMDVRRDTDTRKNFTVTLLDIDTALTEYLESVINPTVIDAGTNIQVPIIYGNPERWKAIQNDGYYRDINGKIQLPAIMFKRSSFSKNENLQTFNRYLTYPVMTKFSEKNQYTKFSLLNDSVAPVDQIHAVTLPDHIKVEYEFMVWTEYVEQMNGILEKINFASEDYWGDPQRFKFRVTINDYTHTTEVSSDKDRMVRTSFSLSLFAYLLPESFEDRKSTVQKLLTPKKINITAEITNNIQLNVFNKIVTGNSFNNSSIYSPTNMTASYLTPENSYTITNLTASGKIIYKNAVLLDYGFSNMPATISTVLQNATSSYNAAFFDYAIFSASNSRAGTIMSTWNDGSIVYNETCTMDIGTTQAITMTVALSGGNVQLLASGSVNNWNIKASARYI
jgi:hypothetical protein